MAHPTLTPRSWRHSQLRRLGQLRRAERSDPSTTWLGYWCSDQHGRPANHATSKPRDWTARRGLVQRVEGPLSECTEHALHATREPHRWAGVRVWIVALIGERIDSKDHKSAALVREIVGEVLPEDASDLRVAARTGIRNLTRANLYGADLTGAGLYGADLTGANLARANLARANLARANLARASLYGADLTGASLYGADLDGADLYGANLNGANLNGANRLPSDQPIPGWIVMDGILRRKP